MATKLSNTALPDSIYRKLVMARIVCCFIGIITLFDTRLAECQVVEQVVKEQVGQLLNDKRLTSASVAIVFQKKKYTLHFGELDPGKKNCPTDKTLYEIASVTKTMTGTLASIAIEEERLEIENSVASILGNEFSNLSFEKDDVSIKHLLTHTSGLPLNPPGVVEFYRTPSVESYIRARDFLQKLTKNRLINTIQNTKLRNRPGQIYHYSNVAPNLIALILEKRYKKPFDDLLKEKIFKPYGMTRTWINVPDNERINIAQGYDQYANKMPSFKKRIKIWGAAGRVKTNAKDMASFIEKNLNLTDKVIRRSHQPLFRDTEEIEIAFFWEVTNDAIGKRVEHHGGLYGMQNWVILYPEKGLGISIITNRSFPQLNVILKTTALNIAKKLTSLVK